MGALFVDTGLFNGDISSALARFIQCFLRKGV